MVRPPPIQGCYADVFLQECVENQPVPAEPSIFLSFNSWLGARSERQLVVAEPRIFTFALLTPNRTFKSALFRHFLFIRNSKDWLFTWGSWRTPDVYSFILSVL